MNNQPTGTVTFLFTDIEGSTKLWQEQPAAMAIAHARHDAILRQAIEAHNGYIFQVIGDSFCVAFYTARDGVLAALAMQRGLRAEPWGATGPIKVRMGLHTGLAEISTDESKKYEGYATLASVQRVMAVAYGGQVLLSQTTEAGLANALPAAVSLRDLGEHQLKDLRTPLRLYQLLAPELPEAFPPLQSLNAHPNNLPATLTSFIGREKELHETTELLPQTRLLTLIGPGGTGKTRLSLQLAEAHLKQFKHGAWLVELAPLADPAFISSAIAAVFNLREVQNTPLLDTLTDYLRGKHLLLVLDNCEHLVEACATLVEHLLRHCPRLTLVASSREALGISGEAVYRVPSLKGDEALQLFVERATKADSRFKATGENAAAIAQICTRLDGIPLAIELAAARAKLFSPPQIAERLNDRFKLLTGGARTALPRQQTLRALVDWSYQTLNETEQNTLRRLAGFSGGWTFEAAEAVVGSDNVMEGLAGLVNKSLVNVEEALGQTRYTFLETIRQYALDKLLESGEASAMRDQHLTYCLDFANRASDKIVFGHDRYWTDLFALEHDNLRSALRWGCEHDLFKALKLIGFMGNFWLTCGHLSEGQLWCQLALDGSAAWPHDQSDLDQARARGFHIWATLANNQGKHHLAREMAEQAVDRYRALDVSLRLARALIVLSTSAFFSGHQQQALAAIHESVALCRAKDYKPELSWALGTLSYITFEMHGPTAQQEIQAYEAEILALDEQGGGGQADIALKSFRARIAYFRGDIETARRYAAEILQYHQATGNTLAYNGYKSTIAHGLRTAGNFAAALPLYRETIVGYQDIGHRGAVAHQLECFAFIAKAQARGERAVTLLSAAEALREITKSLMTPQERAEYDKQVAELRAGLEEQRFAMLWTAGRALTLEQAVEFALKD